MKIKMHAPGSLFRQLERVRGDVTLIAVPSAHSVTSCPSHVDLSASIVHSASWCVCSSTKGVSALVPEPFNL